MRILIVLACLYFTPSVLASETLLFTSGTQQATLLELYTSEGCSSCPPADRWFSQLRDHPRLWRDLVPVAFHVDYWNYLGWEDRFADPAFSVRQRKFKAEGTARAVYTPGMMAAGHEWREWRYRGGTLPTAGKTTGELRLSVQGGQLQATFEAHHKEPLQLHVAVLGFGLQTPVKRGENRGELLRHDFVVLGYQQHRGSGEWNAQLPEVAYGDEAETLALAVWVSTASSQVPLQAVGGWLGTAGAEYLTTHSCYDDAGYPRGIPGHPPPQATTQHRSTILAHPLQSRREIACHPRPVKRCTLCY